MLWYNLEREEKLKKRDLLLLICLLFFLLLAKRLLTEFHEVNEVLARHESSLDHVNATLQTLLTEF